MAALGDGGEQRAARRRKPGRRRRDAGAPSTVGKMSTWPPAARRGPAALPAPEHERHLERRLVGEEAVRQLAVLAERLAVVGGHDHQRRRLAAAEERREERREEGVRGRHLAQIGIGLEAGGEGLRRRVGGVRVVEVHPEEARLAGVRRPPGERRGHHLVARPLGDHELAWASSPRDSGRRRRRSRGRGRTASRAG